MVAKRQVINTFALNLLHVTIMSKFLILLLLVPFFSRGQCVLIVESTNDYEVVIEMDITGISAPSSCPFGYNFNVLFDYNISFIGLDAPANLFTLQGTIGCTDYPSNFFNLPNGGGSGSGTTVSNPYNPNSDCATATDETLGCNSVFIQIQGPGIPNQTVECVFGSPLPITLTAFDATAERGKVYLNWTTASEQNNDYFTIEHSADGKNWNDVTEVPAVGNSTLTQHYQTLHETPIYGINYYRLKQTDFNGEFEYFQPISIDLSKTNGPDDLILYPNPASESVTLTGSSLTPDNIELIDAYGRNINVELLAIHPHSLRLAISALTPGLYFVKTKNGTKKLIVSE